MIVRFDFEHQKPAFSFCGGILVRNFFAVLVMSVMNVNENRAGVVFIAHFKVGKFSMLAQKFHSDDRHVHQSDWLAIRFSGIF